MVAIPKVVGILSCGFMLCLGLSGNAALATDEMQPGQPPERIGGQSGTKSDDEKLKGAARQPSAERRGGQAGMKSETNKLKRGSANTDTP